MSSRSSDSVTTPLGIVPTTTKIATSRDSNTIPNNNRIIDHNVVIEAIDRKLGIIYKIVVFHCAFMLVWTITTNFYHNIHHLEANFEGRGYLPHRLFTKYEGHPLVFATHITPAMFWVICIPLQFHPSVRKTYPKFHRYLGRAFLSTSCLMAIGVIIILKRKLLFEHYVNNHNRKDETADDIPLVLNKIQGTEFSYTVALMGALTVMFLYTAWNAVAYAKKKDYFGHQLWVIRHCSWGLWVVSQRILVGTVFLPLCILLYGRQGAFGPKGRYLTFFWSGVAGAVVSVGTAEYAIRLLRQRKEASAPDAAANFRRKAWPLPPKDGGGTKAATAVQNTSDGPSTGYRPDVPKVTPPAPPQPVGGPSRAIGSATAGGDVSADLQHRPDGEIDSSTKNKQNHSTRRNTAESSQNKTTATNQEKAEPKDVGDEDEKENMVQFLGGMKVEKLCTPKILLED